MGKSILFALILGMVLSTAKGDERVAKNGQGLTLSYVGTFIAAGVYASTGPGVASTISISLAATLAKNEIEARKQVAKMLINDVQDYYQSGQMSPNLLSSVKGLKAEDSSLADAEALDLLNAAALELLE